MGTEAVTGQQEFARLMKHFMETGKSSTRMKSSRGGENEWSFAEVETRAGLGDKTVRNWAVRGIRPEWENYKLIFPLFFDPDVVSGKTADSEFIYFRDLHKYWRSAVPFDVSRRGAVSAEHPLEGRYLLLRQTFDAPQNFALFDVSFVFSHKAGRLEFRTTEFKDRDSNAFITQPEMSPHIEIVEIRQDGFNSLTICSVPDEDGYIYGAIFTMAPFSRNAHLPSIAPVVFFPFDETVELGLVSPNDQRYDRYAELIARSRDPIVFKLHNLVSF
ncbi:MAG: hypothetical protein C0519_16025 [Hyphomicrobium sp.]|nr:hypothetical protein [Hyphomicrobium sp.]